MLRESCADCIKRNMKRFNVTKAEICRGCKMSYSTLQKILNGDCSVHFDYVLDVFIYFENIYESL